MISIIIIVWFLSGISGFIFWWTTEWDLTMNELPTIFLISFTGPLAWIIGLFIHGKGSNKVLIKKRLMLKRKGGEIK